jgi:CheY-like chemotaxis protein
MRDPVARTILLVEDNENDIELTLLALERAGVENPVHVVRDGVQAIDYLQRRSEWEARPDVHPAVTLLDKKLPKVDSHQVLATVKSDNRLKHIPIVMLTSSREKTDLLKSYDLGANAYVVKPVEFHEFMDAIRDIGTSWIVLNEGKPHQKSA